MVVLVSKTTAFPALLSLDFILFIGMQLDVSEGKYWFDDDKIRHFRSGGVVGWVTRVLLSFSRHSLCLHVRMCHHHLCSTGPLTEAYNRGGRQSRKPECHTLNQKITDTGDITSIPPCRQNRALSIVFSSFPTRPCASHNPSPGHLGRHQTYWRLQKRSAG